MHNTNRPEYIIVVGASAGGLNALTELVGHLKPDLNIAVFIVMHIASTSVSDFLVLRLQPHTLLKCVIAEDGMPVEQGHIYIGSSAGHLLIKENNIQIGRGPEENRWKPSIDVLFRSAAAAWSSRVIGIVLTGLLDDGTTGMIALKKSGAVCIVQDPNEAEYPDMPLSVLGAIEVDYCVPLAEIGNKITTLVSSPLRDRIPAPQEVLIEAEIAFNVVSGYSNVEKLGQKSHFACPDCGGGLWHVDEDAKIDRYRCHIGHAYTESDLALKQNEVLESTLWVALRMMEERKTLLNKMEKRNLESGFKLGAANYKKKITELDVHIEKLKEVLFATQDIKEAV